MLTARNLSYEVATRPIFEDVTVSISPGDKVGLVGPNGAGKTTLLRILTGEVRPTAGQILHEDVEVGQLPQDLRPFQDMTVHDFIEDATGVRKILAEYEQANRAHTSNPGDQILLENYCEIALRLGHYDVDSFTGRLEKSLKASGLSPDVADRIIGSLSGGQRTRVALAALMASKFDVVLLDEPTNNLDIDGVTILERFIKRSRAAFLMVSHDRRFLRNATTRIVELLGVDGINNYGLGYDEYVSARQASYENQVKDVEQHRQAVRALETATRNARVQSNSAERGGGKRTDNDKLTANYRSSRASGHLAGQASSLQARLERLREDAPHPPQEPVSLSFMFAETEPASQRLATMDDVLVRYDGGASFGPYNLSIMGGEKVAITGANGTGKSTLIKALLNEMTPTNGVSRISPSARVAYIDQNQTLPLDKGSPVENLLKLAPGLPREEAIHLLVKFNLSRDMVLHTTANTLSGGERAKILLASVVAKKANLLILDEPTNNLDIPTIEGLQEALAGYDGAILIVSHDRDFIDGIGVQRTIEIK